MIEALANFAEVAAAIAVMALLAALMNTKKNNDEHTLEPVKIPVKSDRKNRK